MKRILFLGTLLLSLLLTGAKAPQVEAKITSISCFEEIIAVREDGTVTACPEDSPGTTELAQTINNTIPGIQHINLNQYVSLAIDTNSTLWGWGIGQQGMLPQRALGEMVVPLMDDVVAADTAGEYCVAAQRDGSLWMWGNGKDFEPTQIAIEAVDVRAFGATPLFLKIDGTLWGWKISMPPALPQQFASDVRCFWVEQGGLFTLTEDNRLWFHRDNTEKTGYEDAVLVLKDVSYADYGVVVKEDGSLWISSEGLAQGLASELKQVKEVEDVVFAEMGTSQIAALTSDGTVWDISRETLEINQAVHSEVEKDEHKTLQQLWLPPCITGVVVVGLLSIVAYCKKKNS